MRALQLCIKVNTEIATNKELNPKTRIEASVKVVDANIMAYNILENGPKPCKGALPKCCEHKIRIVN